MGLGAVVEVEVGVGIACGGYVKGLCLEVGIGVGLLLGLGWG